MVCYHVLLLYILIRLTADTYRNSHSVLLCTCDVHLKEHLAFYWSFVEKTSVKQSMKCKVSSNFQMSSLHLSQTDPQ